MKDNVSNPKSNLYLYSMFSAVLPYPIFALEILFHWWPPLFLTPVFLAAYVWLTITIVCIRKEGSRRAVLLLLFPVAFLLPIVMIGFVLWGRSSVP